MCLNKDMVIIMHKLKIALYGDNGHQIYEAVCKNEKTEVVSVCGIPKEKVEQIRNRYPDIQVFDSLDNMIKNTSADMISLCSPIRKNQKNDTITALKAGLHVYAEKPAAFSESELDEILQTSQKTGCLFHEMADTVFHQPFFSMRKLVTSGALGEITQIFAQKSYPYLINGESRPSDETIDGGITMQAGIHAFRMAEHCTGMKITEIFGIEGARRGVTDTSSLVFKMENGALGNAIINYYNPPVFGSWGNDQLRIFGTNGMAEITNNGKFTRWFNYKKDMGELPYTETCPVFFDCFINRILDGIAMPISLEEELHPLRVAIRAKQSIK